MKQYIYIYIYIYIYNIHTRAHIIVITLLVGGDVHKENNVPERLVIRLIYGLMKIQSTVYSRSSNKKVEEY